jgi:hypothetical protein
MTTTACTRSLKAALIICGPLLLLAVPWVLTACQARPAQAVVTATPTRLDTRIEVTQTPTQTLLDVVSPSGIGEADVRLTEGTRPARLVLRLHLRGLEQFRLIYGDTIITAAVASVGKPVISQQRGSIAAPTSEEALSASSHFWLPMRLVTDAAAQARIPLENGFFELEAPSDFLTGEVRAFRFEWIDFFR